MRPALYLLRVCLSVGCREGFTWSVGLMTDDGRKTSQIKMRKRVDDAGG